MKLARLRDRLDAVGYPSADAPPVLGRLFSDGMRVAEADAKAALGDAFDDCLANGLIATEDGTAVARYRIAAHDDLLLVLDPPETGDDHLYVMPPSGSTRTVAQAMQRQPCESALDLGCGCGLLALLMAGHCRRVVACDANPRAVELTALSAGLNRLANVETRVGSWLKPVAGETFDQIVCNPPYVISPENARLFRDAGLEGDAVCERIVRAVPRHLNPGGVAQVLVNWVVRDDGRDPVDDWTTDSGCDVLLQRLPTFDPAGYARHWLGDRADGPSLGLWLRYYERLGAVALGAGVVTLVRHRT